MGNEANAQLHKDLRDDGLAGLYIVEGAKDDDRCGIGIHAENAAVLEMVDAWGRNQLGHACVVVARHFANLTLDEFSSFCAVTCRVCDGSGKLLEDVCPLCDGEGWF